MISEKAILAIQAAKALKRRQYSIELMQDYKGQYSCDDCIHKISGACEYEDCLPDGCEYYHNIATGETFIKTSKIEKYPLLKEVC